MYYHAQTTRAQMPFSGRRPPEDQRFSSSGGRVKPISRELLVCLAAQRAQGVPVVRKHVQPSDLEPQQALPRPGQPSRSAARVPSGFEPIYPAGYDAGQRGTPPRNPWPQQGGEALRTSPQFGNLYQVKRSSSPDRFSRNHRPHHAAVVSARDQSPLPLPARAEEQWASPAEHINAAPPAYAPVSHGSRRLLRTPLEVAGGPPPRVPSTPPPRTPEPPSNSSGITSQRVRPQRRLNMTPSSASLIHLKLRGKYHTLSAAVQRSYGRPSSSGSSRDGGGPSAMRESDPRSPTATNTHYGAPHPISSVSHVTTTENANDVATSLGTAPGDLVALSPTANIATCPGSPSAMSSTTQLSASAAVRRCSSTTASTAAPSHSGDAPGHVEAVGPSSSDETHAVEPSASAMPESQQQWVPPVLSPETNSPHPSNWGSANVAQHPSWQLAMSSPFPNNAPQPVDGNVILIPLFSFEEEWVLAPMEAENHNVVAMMHPPWMSKLGVTGEARRLVGLGESSPSWIAFQATEVEEGTPVMAIRGTMPKSIGCFPWGRHTARSTPQRPEASPQSEREVRKEFSEVGKVLLLLSYSSLGPVEVTPSFYPGSYLESLKSGAKLFLGSNWSGAEEGSFSVAGSHKVPEKQATGGSKRPGAKKSLRSPRGSGDAIDVAEGANSERRFRSLSISEREIALNHCLQQVEQCAVSSDTRSFLFALVHCARGDAFLAAGQLEGALAEYAEAARFAEEALVPGTHLGEFAKDLHRRASHSMATRRWNAACDLLLMRYIRATVVVQRLKAMRRLYPIAVTPGVGVGGNGLHDLSAKLPSGVAVTVPHLLNPEIPLPSPVLALFKGRNATVLGFGWHSGPAPPAEGTPQGVPRGSETIEADQQTGGIPFAGSNSVRAQRYMTSGAMSDRSSVLGSCVAHTLSACDFVDLHCGRRRDLQLPLLLDLCVLSEAQSKFDDAVLYVNRCLDIAADAMPALAEDQMNYLLGYYNRLVVLKRRRPLDMAASTIQSIWRSHQAQRVMKSRQSAVLWLRRLSIDTETDGQDDSVGPSFVSESEGQPHTALHSRQSPHDSRIPQSRLLDIKDPAAPDDVLCETTVAQRVFCTVEDQQHGVSASSEGPLAPSLQSYPP